jgi:hypothetical protein
MRKTRPLAEKLDAQVDRSGGPDACWPWHGGHHKEGYGVVHYRVDGVRRTTTASRAAYAIEHGGMPPADQFVCHRCDNPPCCNPKHLYLGTQTDNMRDRIEHGAGYHRSFTGISVEVQEAVLREYRSGVRGLGQHAIAAKYGISRRQVQRLAHSVR